MVNETIGIIEKFSFKRNVNLDIILIFLVKDKLALYIKQQFLFFILNAAKKILGEYFGYDSFRIGQEEIIESILSSKYVIAILPTGAGKSICYQIPALLSDNFSIVITPLIALMKDQVDSLNKGREIAAYINSTMSFMESEEVLHKISLGKIKLLYLAPEKLESLKFADKIKELKPTHLFVDEAHCISEWGHSFRPSYLKIKEFIEHVSIERVSAFTATATPEVVEDIIAQLELKEPEIFVRGFKRENLHLNVIISKSKKKKCKELLQEINGSAVIYTSSRRKSAEVAEYLSLGGFPSSFYHAGLPSAERRRVQEDFINGANKIIVATNAFGMGIDKRDIRVVIHYNIPGSIENYYQEIGRAGRDAENSFCFLLFDEKDLAIQNHFISASHPNKELIKNIYKAICDYNRVAVGSRPKKDLIVEREYISNYTQTRLNKGLLHASLKFLESAGYLVRISEYEKKDTLQVVIGKEKLKYFVKSTNSKQLKNILLLLLQELGKGIFLSPVGISLIDLSQTFQIPANDLRELLTTLDNLGIISFTQSIPNETVRLTTERVADNRLTLNYKNINESYLNSRRKLEKMVDYVFTQECRFKYILKYFGENLDHYKCGKCDNCISSNKISDFTAGFISDAVKNILVESDQEISEKTLIQILKGENVKDSFKMFNEFGACRNYSTIEIKYIIQQLISKREINKISGSKNYISMNQNLRKEVDVQSAKLRQKSDDDFNADLLLFNLLKEVRKKAAKKFNQSADLVCPDTILRQIVKRKPTSKHEILSINGFNNRMLNKAGNEFIDVIKNFLNQEEKSKWAETIFPLPSNITRTQTLLSRKYTLAEMAETLKQSEAIVSMQIETIIEYNPLTEIKYLFNEDDYELIMTEIKKGYHSLKELKERLPSNISYSGIRIAAAKHRFSARLLA